MFVFNEYLINIRNIDYVKMGMFERKKTSQIYTKVYWFGIYFMQDVIQFEYETKEERDKAHKILLNTIYSVI